MFVEWISLSLVLNTNTMNTYMAHYDYSYKCRLEQAQREIHLQNLSSKSLSMKSSMLLENRCLIDSKPNSKSTLLLSSGLQYSFCLQERKMSCWKQDTRIACLFICQCIQFYQNPKGLVGLILSESLGPNNHHFLF